MNRAEQLLLRSILDGVSDIRNQLVTMDAYNRGRFDQLADQLAGLQLELATHRHDEHEQ